MAWVTNPSITAGTVATTAEANTWSQNLNLLGEFVSLYSHGTPAYGGAPASSAASFLIQGGTDSLSFSGGNGTLTFPTAFPNGVLAVIANVLDSTPGNKDTVQVGSTYASGVVFAVTIGGSVASGSHYLSWLAIGF